MKGTGGDGGTADFFFFLQKDILHFFLLFYSVFTRLLVLCITLFKRGISRVCGPL